MVELSELLKHNLNDGEVQPLTELFATVAGIRISLQVFKGERGEWIFRSLFQ